MKFIPRHAQIVGRTIMKRVLTTIVRPDENKNTTKFILIDGLGPEAAAAGLKVGDIVLPTKIGNVMIDGGVSVRPIMVEQDVAFVLADVRLEDFYIQTEDGKRYVSLDDKEAAASFCQAKPENGRASAEALS